MRGSTGSRRFCSVFFFLLAIAAIASQAAGAAPFVRLRGDVVQPLGGGSSSPGLVRSPSASETPAAIVAESRAWFGESVPGGGTLYGIAFADPATIDGAGRIVFYSRVDGSERNQAILVADSAGLQPIVFGCGDGGGGGNHGTCGDPSPIGGTFAGFFGGTDFAPAVNHRGDMLFMADIANGTSPRGLFLYTRSDGSIVKVAAVGDALPAGGTIDALSPGSLNNLGEAVFLVQTVPGSYEADVFSWKNGQLAKVAAVGDPAPGGGTFVALGREWLGFVDGTEMPVGAPAINDGGQIGFWAMSSLGSPDRGIVVSTAGVQQWYMTDLDTTPIGGHYLDMFQPVMNDGGQIAFYADVELSPGKYSGGWFVGKPGAFRKAIAFFDIVGGAEVLGLAVSRNPMTPLDNSGNLSLWVTVGDAADELSLLSRANGTLVTLAKMGDPSPIGGQIGMMNPWSSRNQANKTTFGAATPGASALNAWLVISQTGCAGMGEAGSIAPMLACFAIVIVAKRRARAANAA